MPGPVRRSVPVPADLPQQVAAALAEDIGGGDLTAALIPPERNGRATVITREAAIVCGIPYVEASLQAGRFAGELRLAWSPKATRSARIRILFSGRRTRPRAADRRAHRAQFFAAALSGTATAAHRLCACCSKARAAGCLIRARPFRDLRTGAKVRGARRRRTQPSHGTVRRNSHQGKSHRGGRVDRDGGRRGEAQQRQSAGRSRGRGSGAIAGSDRRRAPTSPCSTISRCQAMREAWRSTPGTNKPLKIEASGGITSSHDSRHRRDRRRLHFRRQHHQACARRGSCRCGSSGAVGVSQARPGSTQAAIRALLAAFSTRCGCETP